MKGRRFAPHVGVVVGLAAALFSPPTLAQCGGSKLTGGTSGGFGGGVNVRGTRAIVGAPSELVSGVTTGAAYIYRKNGLGWTLENRVLATDRLSGDQLGAGVSIDGDWAVAGAPGRAEGGASSGAAYIFRWNGSAWAQFQKIRETPGATAGDRYGTSVSISGNVIAVGAWSDDERATGAGAVFMYRFNGSTWVFEQKLTASDGQLEDHLGFSVSLDGAWLLACADEDDDRGSNSGSAYYYQYNGSSWVERQKIVAPDGTANDLFGWNVSLSFPVSILGSVQDGPIFAAQGSAYIFRHNGVNWVFERRLNASDPGTNDLFGFSVAIDGNIAVVGAPRDDVFPSDSGSIYVFDNTVGTTWVQRPRISPADGAALDQFGQTVSVDAGNMIFAGAPGDDDAGGNAGSAYYFILSPPEVTDQPDSITRPLGGTATFSITTLPATGVTYLWRKGGVGLSDGGRISGATSATLTISALEAGDAGNYDCVVTNGCGATTSSAATLTLGSTVVRGDPNCDGFVNFDDINAFIVAIVSEKQYAAEFPSCNWLNADTNEDGLVNFDDISTFTCCLIAATCSGC